MTSNTSILVVEDDAIISQDIQRTLTSFGYTVPRVACTATEALRAVEELTPDLVLMDIKLKGPLDGIDTVSEIRRSSDVAIVYLTSHSDELTIARAKETGPHGYLLKPFDERDLRTTIEVALRKHAMERERAASDRWFSTTLRSIGDAVIATDPEERITFMNPVAEELTGWSLAEARTRTLGEVFQLLGNDGKPLESPVVRALRGGFRASLPPNTRLVTREGKHLAVEDSATPIVDRDRAVLGGVVVFRDITERRKLEERLATSERLASIGTLSAGVAHEINNPLTVVVANVEFAFDFLETLALELAELSNASALEPLLKQATDALSDARLAAERVRRIVSDLKKFARIEPAELEQLDLPAVIDAAVRLTEHQIRHHAVLSRAYGTTPLVAANEGKLVQVFTNLLVNAAQAIGDGKASSNEVRLVTRTDSTGRAVAEVHDTGVGIAPSDLGRIFDPFFSTKATGSGLGIGLSICHGIVTSLGGEIEAESQIGRGTMLRISLPAASGLAWKAKSTAPPPPSSRRGRVLVVDDEAAIAKTVERILEPQHEVVVETDGRLALERIARGEVFDVIFCDLMMPNLTGMDVYQAMHAANPESIDRIVFLTGGAFSERSTAFLQTIPNLIVSKPFTGQHLRVIVADYVK